LKTINKKPRNMPMDKNTMRRVLLEVFGTGDLLIGVGRREVDGEKVVPVGRREVDGEKVVPEGNSFVEITDVNGRGLVVIGQ
jgi:hypothetical protein